MRGSRYWTAMVFVLAALLLFGTCSGKQAPINLFKYGPENIVAGQKFNVQVNGQSAIWTYSENATPSTVVVLEDKRLESNSAADGKSVTAYVPDELYAKSGEYPLYLLDTKTGQKSSEIKFIVR